MKKDKTKEENEKNLKRMCRRRTERKLITRGTIRRVKSQNIMNEKRERE